MPHRADLLSRALAAAALAALAGCSTVSDAAPEVEFEALAPSRPPEPQPEARISEAEIVRRPVASVDRLELGVTRDGRLLTAYGAAPTPGWFQALLRPRDDGRLAPDGFLEFDFLAAPPELNGADPEALPAGPGVPAQRAVRADRLLRGGAVQTAAGIRVFAASGPPAAIRLAPPPATEG